MTRAGTAFATDWLNDEQPLCALQRGTEWFPDIAGGASVKPVLGASLSGLFRLRCTALLR